MFSDFDFIKKVEQYGMTLVRAGCGVFCVALCFGITLSACIGSIIPEVALGG